MSKKTSGVIGMAKKVLQTEAQGIARMTQKIGRSFERAVRLMYECEGRVIITGMGKPGFIGRKIAATLASTGTPSMFLHPAEAIHGDLGMVMKQDVIIAISNSGETEEIVRLLSTLKKIGVPIIAMTSNVKSPLAKYAEVVLDLGITREACPLNLAPSTSTTASLAMGDALALCLLEKKGFKENDFAQLHPGGSLGRKLLKVKDLMRTGKNMAVVQEDVTVKKALLAITKARTGSCVIISKSKKLVGIFTDGDLRRHLRDSDEDFLTLPIKKVATKKPTCVKEESLATEALGLLRAKSIDELPVIDKKGCVSGLLDVQDLLKAGFV